MRFPRSSSDWYTLLGYKAFFSRDIHSTIGIYKPRFWPGITRPATIIQKQQVFFMIESVSYYDENRWLPPEKRAYIHDWFVDVFSYP